MEGFLDPNKIINQLDLSPGMIAVDFGSGSGGWVIPLARKLKEGKIFAIDIQEAPLSALKGRANADRIFNIQIIRANVEIPGSSKLGNNSVDLVLMTNLLFQIENKKNVFAEAKRILKQKGKLLVVDWLSGSTMGPESGRVEKEDVKKIAQDFEFDLEKELDAGRSHFCFLFAKK